MTPGLGRWMCLNIHKSHKQQTPIERNVPKSNKPSSRASSRSASPRPKERPVTPTSTKKNVNEDGLKLKALSSAGFVVSNEAEVGNKTPPSPQNNAVSSTTKGKRRSSSSSKSYEPSSSSKRRSASSASEGSRKSSVQEKSVNSEKTNSKPASAVAAIEQQQQTDYNENNTFTETNEFFKPSFLYGNNDAFPETINISPDCHWWKSRSTKCSKCQVQPLAQRPKPTGGGYGPRKQNSEGGRANNGGQRERPRDAQQYKKAQGGWQNNDTGYSKNDNTRTTKSHRSARGYSSGGCECVTPPYLTETQAQYGPPEMKLQQLNSGMPRDKVRELMESDDQYVKRMKKILDHRPRWNHDTTVPPPSPYETLNATEAKVRVLDSMTHHSTSTGEDISTATSNHRPKTAKTR